MILIQFIFWLLVACLVLLTFLPLVRISHGSVRGVAFPRLQYICTAAGLGLVAMMVLDQPHLFWALGALALVMAANAAYVVKFTRLWPTQSRAATRAQIQDVARQVSILTCNVKKSNRDHLRLIDLVHQEAPDLVILIEIDEVWAAALDPLARSYPFGILHPQDNGYGIGLLSRLPILEHSIDDMVTERVPSIRAAIRLPAGEAFRLYAVHPEPPTATHDTLGRDSEIAAVGMAARRDALPAIVAGDLNDVAWSTTTRRFQRLSQLLDPRVGRGFFSTFHADYPVFRWPLDHLFHDPRFRLIDVRRGPHIGSDHFPILFRLALAAAPAGDDSVPAPEHGETAATQDMIAEERRRDRDPIGEDWE